MRILAASFFLFPTLVPAQPDPKTMDNYVFTLIWSKPDHRTTTKEEGDRMQAAHMAHIESMSKQGDLAAAGPANAPGSRLRGIFVFRTPIEKANELSNADPTVKEGLLEMESHPWYSYKGIGDVYKNGPDASFKMATFQLALIRKGPNVSSASPEEMKAYAKQHQAGIAENRRLGKMVCAGPILDGGDLVGISVFATSAEEAKAIFDKDPFIAKGIMKIDWYTWYAGDKTFPPLPK